MSFHETGDWWTLSTVWAMSRLCIHAIVSFIPQKHFYLFSARWSPYHVKGVKRSELILIWLGFLFIYFSFIIIFFSSQKHVILTRVWRLFIFTVHHFNANQTIDRALMPCCWGWNILEETTLIRLEALRYWIKLITHSNWFAVTFRGQVGSKRAKKSAFRAFTELAFSPWIPLICHSSVCLVGNAECAYVFMCVYFFYPALWNMVLTVSHLAHIHTTGNRNTHTAFVTQAAYLERKATGG